VLLLGAVVVASTVRDDRAADRAVTGALRLVSDEVPVTGAARPGYVRIAVRNDGSSDVRVLSARLLAPGYAEVPVSSPLAAGSMLTLELPDTASCGPSLLDHPATEVSLRLRTTDGRSLTRALPLSPVAAVAVNHAARARCGYLPAEESLSFMPTSVLASKGSVVVRASVANTGLLAFKLFRLLPLPGLSLTSSPATPLDLPTQAKPHVLDRAVVVTVTLRVRSCSAMRASLTGARHTLLRGWLLQEATVTEVPVLVVDPTSSFRPAVDPGLVLDRLLATCP
jgi:hypothetical protein